MASLKECRARAKKLGLTVTRIPESSSLAGRYRYRVGRYYAKNVDDMAKELAREARAQNKGEMLRKLNGHRPKYGYKTVPRKKRGVR